MTGNTDKQNIVMVVECSAVAFKNIQSRENISSSAQQKKKKCTTCSICEADLVWLRGTSVMHERIERQHIGFLKVDDLDSDSPQLNSLSIRSLPVFSFKKIKLFILMYILY